MRKDFSISISSFSVSAPIDTPCTFAFLSDLHCCDNRPVLESLASIHPDGVLVGGDFIHNNTLYKEGIEFLRQSALLYPTFCSVGNHELRYKHDLSSLVRTTGAVLLDDSSVTFHGIQIGGLSSALKEQHNLNYVIRRQIPNLSWLKDFSRLPGYKLLLCHHPEYFDKYICRLPVDLTLSGHAHGGQWRAFNRGFFAVGQGLLPKYTAGMYEHDRLLVSKGIGNASFIPRINNDPEVIALTFLPEG